MPNPTPRTAVAITELVREIIEGIDDDGELLAVYIGPRPPKEVDLGTRRVKAIRDDEWVVESCVRTADTAEHCFRTFIDAEGGIIDSYEVQ